MTNAVSRTVADNIRAEMARRKMSQRALADALGKPQPFVYRRLAGRVAFDVDELAQIAGLLDMDARDLLPAAS